MATKAKRKTNKNAGLTAELRGELSTVLENYTRRERLTVAECAERYRIVHAPPKPKQKWRNALTPYLVEVQEALTSREYDAVVLVAPAQSGKTALIENWALYSAKVSPSDMLILQTTKTVARDFKMQRLDRMRRACPAFANEISPSPQHDNTFDITFKQGVMLFLAWPTADELSGKSVARCAITDYDRIKSEIGDEGSAFDMIMKRTTSFGSMAMTYCESSPSKPVLDYRKRPQTEHEAPPCEGIFGAYNRGDRRRFYVKCLHEQCGEYFIPSFKHMSFDDEAEDIHDASQNVAMVCPHCGGEHASNLKAALNRTNAWLREGETIDREGNVSGTPRTSRIASFWLPGPAAVYQSWDSLVFNELQARRELAATGSETALKKTRNQDQCEPYIPLYRVDKRTAEDLENRMENLGQRVVPDAVRFLIATVDVQKDAFDCAVWGFGPNVEIWLIDRFDIHTSERSSPYNDDEVALVQPGNFAEDWRLLEKHVIHRAYPLASDPSRAMRVKLTACDSGGREGTTANAYAFYRRLMRERLTDRFMLVKGDNGRAVALLRRTWPDASRKKGQTADGRGEIPVYLLNTTEFSDWADNILGREQHGPGSIHFPSWLPRSVFEEMVSESKNERGIWQQDGRRSPNETWDLLKYALVAATALKATRIKWDVGPVPPWARPHDDNTLVIEAPNEADSAPTEPAVVMPRETVTTDAPTTRPRRARLRRRGTINV